MEISLLTVLPVFLTAFVIAFVMSPVSIKIAKKFGIVDIPKDSRRMHKRSIPRFGGFAIFTATMITLAFFEGDNPQIKTATKVIQTRRKLCSNIEYLKQN